MNKLYNYYLVYSNRRYKYNLHRIAVDIWHYFDFFQLEYISFYDKWISFLLPLISCILLIINYRTCKITLIWIFCRIPICSHYKVLHRKIQDFLAWKYTNVETILFWRYTSLSLIIIKRFKSCLFNLTIIFQNHAHEKMPTVSLAIFWICVSYAKVIRKLRHDIHHYLQIRFTVLSFMAYIILA